MKFKNTEHKRNVLINLCDNYQNHLLAEIKKLSKVRKIYFSYNSSPTHITTELKKDEKPVFIGTDIVLTMELYDRQRTPEQKKISLVIEKYYKVENLLRIAKDENDSDFSAFSAELSECKAKLIQHGDSESTRFLKNIGFILSVPLLGLGLAISYFAKNSISFWKSNGEIAVNSMDEVLSEPKQQP